MPEQGIDRLARALARSRTRRQAVIAACSSLLAVKHMSARAVTARATPSVLEKRRKRAERRNRRKSGKDGGGNSDSISRDCRRFAVSAGPSPNDRFQHIDDDLLIELYPKGRNKDILVVLDDANKSPNGPGGSHPKPPPFKARVGDSIHIVARNEVVGGCELDEIWLHCTDAGGGKMKLTDAISPEDCQADSNRLGIFFEETVRIEP